MNLILFEPAETARPLPRTDARATHIVNVLRRTIGEAFDVGIVNGPRGKGKVTALSDTELLLEFEWQSAPAAPEPLTLIVGLPRPQTARDILRDATSLGVAALHFVRTEKGEASYAQSTLWTSGEWRRHLVAGAEQAFDTRIPDVTFGASLAEIVDQLHPATTRVALDNYEASVSLGDWPMTAEQPLALAIGGERGWSGSERDLLRARCFGLAHLGARVLRTETAVVAAVAIVRAQLGWMR